jgi:hypothetical protein
LVLEALAPALGNSPLTFEPPEVAESDGCGVQSSAMQV